MRTLFIDYETYYADDFSIGKIDGRKANRTEYIHDPRFKVHGMAVSIDGTPDEWIGGEDLPMFWRDMESYVEAVCCHNGLFDHAITAKYYTSKRFFLLDTMSMAQGVFGQQKPDLRMSLASLAKYYWPDDPGMWKLEGDFGLDPSKGKRDLSPSDEAKLSTYAKQDNRICRKLLEKLLAEDYPWDTELENIHITLGMGVWPSVHMDSLRAAQIHAREVKFKEEVVTRLKLDRATLRSNNKFADVLRSLGVAPPTKWSEKQQKEVYAFAAKDPEFMELQEHEDLTVQAVVEARIGEKASQAESRAATFARLPSPCPVPMRYAGAHTGRHAGDEFNLLNLKRGGELRGCIKAPEGYRILVSDLAAIELRMNAWFCEEHWLLEALREGRDVYCDLATAIYGRPITEADEAERFMGKQGELSFQYGSGWKKFLKTLKEKGVKEADETLARDSHRAYKTTHRAIAAMWVWLRDTAVLALAGSIPPVERRGCRFEKGRVRLPSGRSLWYPELRINEEGEWTYRFRLPKGKVVWKKLWHGLLLENIVQAMSYDVFMMHARRLLNDYNMPLALAVYDESGFVVHEDSVAVRVHNVLHVQSQVPDWCADLPCKGKASYGQTYLEAK